MQAPETMPRTQHEAVALTSRITCPQCGFTKEEVMPTEACQYFYECDNCHARLTPKQGDCCVFCSYGDVPCPPKTNGSCDC